LNIFGRLIPGWAIALAAAIVGALIAAGAQQMRVSALKAEHAEYKAEQAALWRSTVTLSEQFYAEVIEHPIPVDLRALKALKRSPLALDIYCWLTYRASYAKRDSNIPWPALAVQFGAEYGRVRDFKAAFLSELRKVTLVYPEARIEDTDTGLLVKPSKPHITRRKADT